MLVLARGLLHLAVLQLPVLELATVSGLGDQAGQLGRRHANHWEIASTYLMVRLLLLLT